MNMKAVSEGRREGGRGGEGGLVERVGGGGRVSGEGGLVERVGGGGRVSGEGGRGREG